MVQRITPNFNAASEWVPSGTKRLDQLPAAYADHADKALLDRTGHGALRIGHVPDPDIFSSDSPNEEFIIDFTLIKRAREAVYHVPQQFAQYENTIKVIAEDQEVRSTNAFNKYAFLFLQRSFVKAGHFQRNDNWHRDHLPQNISQYYGCGNNDPCSIYLVADKVPTVVQDKPVENAHGIFKQHGGSIVTDPYTRQLDPYEIALMNEYVYHRGTVTQDACMRTFMVMIYAPVDEKPRKLPGLLNRLFN